MMVFAGTAFLFVAMLYCADRAMHWCESAPILLDSGMCYLRAFCWAILALAFLALLPPLWDACK